MTIINVPEFISTTIGLLVFLLGVILTQRVAFLRNYSIPEPVAGGLVVALITWALFGLADIQINFALEERDVFLVIFFATIGLNARLSDLVSGGKLLGLLLVMTVVVIVLQDIVGLIGAMIFGFPKAVGVLLGSASLIGGHGTAIAWGPTIEEQTGYAAAGAIGIASATLGLVMAALIGGPIAKFLIDRNDLKASTADQPVVGIPYDGPVGEGDEINHTDLIRSLLAAHIAIILGYIANQAIEEAGLKLPLFVPCLIMGIIMSNTIPYLFPRLVWPARTRTMALLSDYSLSIFLAMSLMSMQLWTLSGLGLALMTVLAMQALMVVALILLVFFKVMGSDYTAAVLSSGFAGFTLGATPTAMANMSSVTKRYGSAPLAFVVLPLVSAFFVDLANAFIIQFFVGL